MKILISTDIEGIQGIIRNEIKDESSKEYHTACQLLTQEVNEIIKIINNHGKHKIIVTDGHGKGNNIFKEKIDKAVKLIQQKPGRNGMIEGIEKVDVLMLIGYHGMANKKNSYFSHTNSTLTVKKVEIEKVEIGESLINTIVAKEYDVKTIFISGTDKAIKEHLKHHKTFNLIVKKSKHQYVAETIKNATDERAKKINEALNKTKKVKHIKINGDSPWKITPTYHFLTENSEHKRLEDGTIIINTKNCKTNFQEYRKLLKKMIKNYNKYLSFKN